MEFVHNLKTSTKEDSGIYTQNSITDDNCYFENRLQQPIADLYIPITQIRDSYSKQYSENIPVENLPLTTEPIINKTQSHYKLLIDNINNTNEPDLINTSNSYNVGEGEVNFNAKDYSDKTFPINDSYLLSENKYQTEKSVTDNEIYKTKDFWTQQVSDIITNEYLVRDIPQYFYDKSIERYALPKYTGGNYFSGEITNSYSEPKVSKNYVTTYTEDEGNVVHEGNKKKGHGGGKYKGNVNYSRGDDGMLVYYDDNKDIYYKDQFDIIQQEVKTSDPNGNNYHKIINNNVKDESISGYEQNIMLRRNDNMIASMNYTMRYD